MFSCSGPHSPLLLRALPLHLLNHDDDNQVDPDDSDYDDYDDLHLLPLSTLLLLLLLPVILHCQLLQGLLESDEHESKKT